MRKFTRTKIKQRILAAALAIGMVGGLLSYTAESMVSKAASDLSNYTVGTKKVVRGMLDQISDLPQIKYDQKTGSAGSWKSLKMGTADRPFTILEIVPYEEIAEFGYLIGGCEPIDPTKACGDQNAMNYINVMNTCTLKTAGEDSYFFTEEPEAQAQKYGLTAWPASEKIYQKQISYSPDVFESIKVKGYYEVVGENEGRFKVKEEAGVKRIVKTTGNLKWHTINAFEDGYSTISFNQTLETASLTNIGDRMYTMREASSSDQLVKVAHKYIYYKNDEVFLKDVIGLQGNAIDTYSVVYKVITPEELNNTPQWSDYADLIYFNTKMHNGDGRTYWSKYNRLGHSLTSPSSFKEGFGSADLSYSAVRHIFDKVTAISNYGGLLVDNSLYEQFESGKKYVTAKVYDYNKDLLTTYSADGRNSNIYKLLLMTVSVNPNLVKQLFLSGIQSDNPGSGASKIKFSSYYQTGDAAEYWWDGIFQMLDRDDFQSSGKDVWNYLNESDNVSKFWKAFKYSNNLHTDRVYVQGHVYTYNGDTSIAQVFRNGNVGAANKFTDFNDFLKTDADTKRIWQTNNPSGSYSTVNQKTAPPSAALRYILGLGTYEDLIYDGELKVLDVEPAIGMTKEYKPDWKVKESMFQMMLPNFSGTFKIEHLTMNTFVGRTDDLNSTYDLIYFGDDSNAFWKDDSSRPGRTNFIDNSLDGWIYFHIGDLGIAGNKVHGCGGIRTANFIAGVNNNLLRFPGNDITQVKVKNLANYLDAGFPVVSDPTLYDTSYMDTTTNIYKFVTTYDADSASNPEAGKSGVYDPTQCELIEARVRSNQVHVTFTKTPVAYNEKDYLPTNGGNAVLEFGFTVDSNEYEYKLFVDQDRNGKFETGESVMTKNANLITNDSYMVASTYVGLIQWRIEVYKKSNPNCRASVEGCSAVKCLDPSRKKDVKVLQIIPKAGTTSADLADEDYKALYSNLDAFNIEVDKITWDEFNNYFVGTGFKFDMGEPISADNPKSDVLEAVVDEVDNLGRPQAAKYRLDKYNMFVIGFGDCYGEVDLHNRDGAAEFLYYFVTSGRSILFTHDTTSLYNKAASGRSVNNVFGYTANAMLRDLMGMNRYGVTSTELGTSNFRTGLKADLEQYRSTSGVIYDSTSKPEKQSYTFLGMKKMGQDSSGHSYRFPYYYMVKDAANTNNNIDGDNGFSGSNGQTKHVKRMNVGQITQYPYNIPETIKVAETHCQWFQLNMEDPELTVWYNLTNDNTHGSTKILAASPEDAANSYYIYSKGNIYYSGVGHSSGHTLEERKLFVNTMIAAYRAIFEPPMVEITNPEANKISEGNYTIRVPQEFNYDHSNVLHREDLGGDTVTIYFRPMDSSFLEDVETRIYFKSALGGTLTDANTIGSVKKYNPSTNESEWTVLSADASSGYFIKLKHAQIYCFKYNKSLLSSEPVLVFESKDAKKSGSGFTYLRMLPQPLFKLD